MRFIPYVAKCHVLTNFLIFMFLYVKRTRAMSRLREYTDGVMLKGHLYDVGDKES